MSVRVVKTKKGDATSEGEEKTQKKKTGPTPQHRPAAPSKPGVKMYNPATGEEVQKTGVVRGSQRPKKPSALKGSILEERAHLSGTTPSENTIQHPRHPNNTNEKGEEADEGEKNAKNLETANQASSSSILAKKVEIKTERDARIVSLQKYDRVSPLSAGNRDEKEKNVSLLLPMFHSHLITMDLMNKVHSMLEKLTTYQARAKSASKIEKRKKAQRYVCGLSQTLRSVQLGRSKMVILAMNLEQLEGLESMIWALLSMCLSIPPRDTSNGLLAVEGNWKVPLVLVPSRRWLAKCVKKKIAISAVSILSLDGAHQEWAEVKTTIGFDSTSNEEKLLAKLTNEEKTKKDGDGEKSTFFGQTRLESAIPYSLRALSAIKYASQLKELLRIETEEKLQISSEGELLLNPINIEASTSDTEISNRRFYIRRVLMEASGTKSKKIHSNVSRYVLTDPSGAKSISTDLLAHIISEMRQYPNSESGKRALEFILPSNEPTKHHSHFEPIVTYPMDPDLPQEDIINLMSSFRMGVEANQNFAVSLSLFAFPLLFEPSTSTEAPLPIVFPQIHILPCYQQPFNLVMDSFNDKNGDSWKKSFNPFFVPSIASHGTKYANSVLLVALLHGSWTDCAEIVAGGIAEEIFDSVSILIRLPSSPEMKNMEPISMDIEKELKDREELATCTQEEIEADFENDFDFDSDSEEEEMTSSKGDNSVLNQSDSSKRFISRMQRVAEMTESEEFKTVSSFGSSSHFISLFLSNSLSNASKSRIPTHIIQASLLKRALPLHFGKFEKMRSLESLFAPPVSSESHWILFAQAIPQNGIDQSKKFAGSEESLIPSNLFPSLLTTPTHIIRLPFTATVFELIGSIAKELQMAPKNVSLTVGGRTLKPKEEKYVENSKPKPFLSLPLSAVLFSNFATIIASPHRMNNQKR